MVDEEVGGISSEDVNGRNLTYLHRESIKNRAYILLNSYNICFICQLRGGRRHT